LEVFGLVLVTCLGSCPPQPLNVLALVLAVALLVVPIVTILQQLRAERAADGSES